MRKIARKKIHSLDEVYSKDNFDAKRPQFKRTTLDNQIIFLHKSSVLPKDKRENA